MTAACVLADDGDAPWIDAELGGLRVHPAQARVVVLDGARIPRLGGEAIVDAGISGSSGLILTGPRHRSCASVSSESGSNPPGAGSLRHGPKLGVHEGQRIDGGSQPYASPFHMCGFLFASDPNPAELEFKPSGEDEV